MEPQFTEDEKRLIDHSKEAVVRYNRLRHKRGGIDTIYACLLPDSGDIYDGAALEPHIICAERHAIANLVLQESYNARIKAIVIADPVPQEQEHGTPLVVLVDKLFGTMGRQRRPCILMQYVQGKNGWTFPKLETLTISDFYPHPYEPKEGLWDNWEPK